MQQFLNNWSMQGVLAADAGQMYIALPNGTFKLTWSDTLGGGETTREIMLATVTDGFALLDRGLEGTDVQEWPGGSFISMRVTAGWLNDVAEKLASLQAQIDALKPDVGVELVVQLGLLAEIAAGYIPSNELGDLSPKVVPYPGVGDVEVVDVICGDMGEGAFFRITMSEEVDGDLLRGVEVQGIGTLLSEDASIDNPPGQTVWIWQVPAAEWLSAGEGAERTVRFIFS